jgi:hypothetical protein
LAKVTLANLETKAMIEWLICFKNFLETKKSFIAAHKSSPTTSYDFLKKRGITIRPRRFVISNTK